MCKKIFMLLCIFTMPLLTQAVCPPNLPIQFGIGRIDPTLPGNHKSPVVAPTVYIDGYALTFDTPCDGCTLQLVNEDNDVVYSIVIPAGTTTLYHSLRITSTFNKGLSYGLSR